MFTLRDKFPFDDHAIPCEAGIKNWNVFAVSEDRQTFWVTAGANDGERVLTHFAPDGNVFASKRLHADTLVSVHEPEATRLRYFLQRAADRAPQSTLLTPVTLRTVRETVPYDGQEYEHPASGISRFVPRWGFSGLPGFSATRPNGGKTLDDPFVQENTHLHRDGWFTRSCVVLPIPAPSFAPDAKAWDMREGIYLTFPDESYRLITRREYFAFLRHVEAESRANNADPNPISRQGDLLFFSGNWGNKGWDGSRQVICQPMDEGCFFVPADHADNTQRRVVELRDMEFDRHVISEDANCVRHPEHGEMPLPGGAWTAVLMPGTSRPFARRGGLD